MSQTQADNPFRPGSGIFPPLLAGRERETEIAMARIARTREGHPHHTALLGSWAIGKTTLLMHWRRLLRDVGDVAVLSLAYPQPVGEFFDGLRLGRLRHCQSLTQRLPAIETPLPARTPRLDRRPASPGRH